MYFGGKIKAVNITAFIGNTDFLFILYISTIVLKGFNFITVPNFHPFIQACSVYLLDILLPFIVDIGYLPLIESGDKIFMNRIDLGRGFFL
jgi:hypothetical protein